MEEVENQHGKRISQEVRDKTRKKLGHISQNHHRGGRSGGVAKNKSGKSKDQQPPKG